MGTTSYRGVVLPGPGDDLLGGFAEAFASAGVVTVAASVAAARLALTSAQSAGATITPARPVYFNIGGILYLADGAKQAGVWVLRPVNEVELVEQTKQIGSTFTVQPETFTPIITSSLQVRPYDRVIQAFGMLWGDVTGRVNLDVRIGDDHVLAQFATGQNATQSATNTARIPAGQAPDIVLGLHGGLVSEGAGSVYLSRADKWNRLVVRADPITMAG